MLVKIKSVAAFFPQQKCSPASLVSASRATSSEMVGILCRGNHVSVM